MLYRAFGWPVPTYIHCPPVMKDAQHKLSKRNGDASYQDLMEKGYLSEAVVNYLLLLGWSPKGEEEIFSMEQMIGIWDPAGISKSPAIFDPAKLRAINAAYIRAPASVARTPRLSRSSSLHPSSASSAPRRWWSDGAVMNRSRAAALMLPRSMAHTSDLIWASFTASPCVDIH